MNGAGPADRFLLVQQGRKGKIPYVPIAVLTKISYILKSKKLYSELKSLTVFFRVVSYIYHLRNVDFT